LVEAWGDVDAEGRAQGAAAAADFWDARSRGDRNNGDGGSGERGEGGESDESDDGAAPRQEAREASGRREAGAENVAEDWAETAQATGPSRGGPEPPFFVGPRFGPIGGGLATGAGLALGTLARDAGGSSGVAAATRAARIATAAHAQAAAAEATTAHAVKAAARQDRKRRHDPGGLLASADPSLASLAAWEAGHLPDGSDSSDSRPKAGSAAALAAAHAAVRISGSCCLRCCRSFFLHALSCACGSFVV
jgi:hypothetical protein